MGRIATKEIEFDEIIEGKVKPFSNSAHIPFSKKYIGRIVKVILPIPEKYFWVLSEKEKKELLDKARKVKKGRGLYSQQSWDNLKEAIRNFSKASWEMEDLGEIVSHIEDFKEIKKLVNKVKKIYDFI